ncbi:MAG: hypothetical protein WCJ59_02945 [bacterium]
MAKLDGLYSFYHEPRQICFRTVEWSVVFDTNKRKVYFKTRINPQIKDFSIDNFDFSNSCPVLILDIYIKDGGDELNRFQVYSNELVKNFLKTKMKVILPIQFYAIGGLSFEEFIDRFATQSRKAELSESQYFAGVWETKTAVKEDDIEFKI